MLSRGKLKSRKIGYTSFPVIVILTIIFCVGCGKAGAPETDAALIGADVPVNDAGGGVSIPARKVSLSKGESAMADMIGFFIYGGRCYVQYDMVENTDIVGEYLGTSQGLIDEWTSLDAYVDYAGSVSGDFFRIKGYDPAFMLCMKEVTGPVSTYICDNGITLKSGEELFEDRLHLSEYYGSLQYETNDSWNYGNGEFYKLTGNDDAVKSFIEALDSASFLKWDDAAALEGKTVSSLYDTGLYHLQFNMSDGTSIHLRLFDKGYVTFQGIRDVCVKLPEETFNEFTGLMKNNVNAEPVPVVDRVVKQLEKCKSDPMLGKYVPTFEPQGSSVLAALVFYKIEPKTALETGTKKVYVEYTNKEDPYMYYSVNVTTRVEYNSDDYSVPMIDSSELSVNALKEYEYIREASQVPLVNVGVWFGDAAVILSSSGVDAETAYKIFNSVLESTASDTEAQPKPSQSEKRISEEQAVEAVKSYCFSQNPDLEQIVNDGVYEVYWTVASNNENETVVLFRSYTGALIRFYIDRLTGDTYVTESVPGIADEEVRTQESLNIFEILTR